MAANVSPHAAMTSTTTTSHLIDKLPAELRNRIYRLALHTQDKIEITPAGFEGSMALLQTCKQVRQEAIGIFFAENGFKVTVNLDMSNALCGWMSAIGDDSIRLLKDVSISIIASEEAAEEFDGRFEQIELGPDDYDLMLSDDAYDILERRVVRKMFDKAVVEMIAYIKSKAPDPACIRVGKGVGRSEAARRIAAASCDMARHLMQAEARTKEDLIAALSCGEMAWIC